MSTTVTPAMIKELRERTGIGMGQCKKALEEANGDMELAITNLRKSGAASAVKKEGRVTNEGMIGAAQVAKAIALVEVNAETDFVVKNERFQQFVQAISQEAAETSPASLEAFLQQKYSKDDNMTIDELRSSLVQAIGENIQIKRLKVLPKKANTSVGVYSHLGGKMVTVVEITGSDAQEELAKDIAMHVAAAAPEYVSPDQVPSEVLEKEKEIARSQVVGKPDFVAEKIVTGKLNYFYDTTCLICQKYIKDDSVKIEDLVKQKGKDLQLTSFERWTVSQ
ncbi:translation elongation factor Ts [Parachlamydia sp. AcF125]|uniref:translation elongation factor Ts n=1 Tax=Parachlamydia sp. AcF125 TaxID=2795736 RepID=UPI001BC973FC|nr:translation elongation factor Ts [Parachlamydia sp. AcF125]MBS4168036.1 Elongation factor Ts [Parachlamydia sp. AcF125]